MTIKKSLKTGDRPLGLSVRWALCQIQACQKQESGSLLISTKSFQAISREVFADGALPKKAKQLIAVAVAHVTWRIQMRRSWKPSGWLPRCAMPLLHQWTHKIDDSLRRNWRYSHALAMRPRRALRVLENETHSVI